MKREVDLHNMSVVEPKMTSDHIAEAKKEIAMILAKTQN